MHRRGRRSITIQNRKYVKFYVLFKYEYNIYYDMYIFLISMQQKHNIETGYAFAAAAYYFCYDKQRFVFMLIIIPRHQSIPVNVVVVLLLPW